MKKKIGIHSELKDKEKRKSGSKLSKSNGTTKSKEKKSFASFKIDFTQVQTVVRGLLSGLKEKSKESNNELFGNEPQRIIMQVNSIKKAFCPIRQLRFVLPHSLHNELTDICLFVPDKKGVRKDVDKSVEYYTEMLEQKNITNINKVLPLKALSTEYSQYEMRRKLANQFDVFLIDGRVAHLLTKRLGREFAYTPKTPISVHLEGKNWKHMIDTALCKTQMTIRPSSDSFAVTVGTTAQSSKEITKNIRAVCEGLKQQFPGSWQNIRSLFLKVKSLPSLPIYMTTKSPNEVPVPVMKSIKAPKDEEVTGELSTMMDAIVKVKSDGTVKLTKLKRRKTAEEDADDDEIIKEAMKNKKKSRSVSDFEHTNHDYDKILEKTEKQVLMEMAEGQSDEESDDEKNKTNNLLDELELEPEPSRKKLAKQAKKENKLPKRKEKIAKTNWIKSTKKGAKKLSKDQRKAMIKVKKAEKIKK